MKAITDNTKDLEGRPKDIFQDITGHKTVNLELVIAHNPEVIIACTGHGEGKNKPFEWTNEIFSKPKGNQ